MNRPTLPLTYVYGPFSTLLGACIACLVISPAHSQAASAKHAPQAKQATVLIAIEIAPKGDIKTVISLADKVLVAWRKQNLEYVYEQIAPQSTQRWTWHGKEKTLRAMKVWRTRGANKLALKKVSPFELLRNVTIGQAKVMLAIEMSPDGAQALTQSKDRLDKKILFFRYKAAAKSFLMVAIKESGRWWLLNEPFDMECPPVLGH
jgi:hypothetical protein